MSLPNPIIGGGFQDILGTPIANGYLLFELSDSASVNTTTKIAAGFTVKINLDSSGNIVAGGQIWANDVMTPATTFYSVSAYSAQGQLVWGPNAQQVLTDPFGFDLGTWTPGITS
jgi:hypothetical protein